MGATEDAASRRPAQLGGIVLILKRALKGGIQAAPTPLGGLYGTGFLPMIRSRDTDVEARPVSTLKKVAAVSLLAYAAAAAALSWRPTR